MAVTSRPVLSGVWTLNRELSDFPKDVAFLSDWLEAEGAAESGREGGRGQRGGSSINRPPMSQPRSEEDSLKMEQIIGEVRNPPSVLTIVQSEAAVTITGAPGVARTFHTSGRRDIQQLDAGPMTTTSRWSGEGLIVEYDVEKGRQLRYTYTRVADRPQVRVEAQLLEKAKAAPIVRIYDAASPDPK